MKYYKKRKGGVKTNNSQKKLFYMLWTYYNINLLIRTLQGN